MKCIKCDEVLDEVMFPICDVCGPKDRDTQVVLLNLNDEMERACMYVCTSRDCSNAGVMMIIPIESKE